MKTLKGTKPHLSDVEKYTLAQICDENGTAALLRFAAQMIAHEAANPDFGNRTRALLSKIALEVDQAESRF